MNHTKSSIRELLGAGQLDAANAAALEYAEYCGLADISNGLLALQSRVSVHQANKQAGTVSYEDFTVNFARLANDLTAWVDCLPNTPKPAGPRKKFLTEANFKTRVAILLLLIKVVVLGWLYYHWSTGGFTADQFQGTATILVPVFAALLAVILEDYMHQHKNGQQRPRYASGPLIAVVYWLFPLYALALAVLIALKAKGSISFSAMNTWLAVVESGLGGYVGKVVHGLFKKNE
ncbi:MAG: hypothetical protein HUU34_02330 [Saprospiraceae bacterium]|nr:hypothetical protein [Saprospiraceae bacterium]